MTRYYRTSMAVEAEQFNGQDMPGLIVNRGEVAVMIEDAWQESKKWLVQPGEALLVVEAHSTAPAGVVFLEPGDWLITYSDGKKQRLHPKTFADYFTAIAPPPPINGQTSDGYHTFDELYQHRHALFAVMLFAYGYAAWKTRKTQDGRSVEGWFIAGLDLPGGQISYHLPDEWWQRLDWVEERERNHTYDGHSAADVLQRLRRLSDFQPAVSKGDYR